MFKLDEFNVISWTIQFFIDNILWILIHPEYIREEHMKYALRYTDIVIYFAIDAFTSFHIFHDNLVLFYKTNRSIIYLCRYICMYLLLSIYRFKELHDHSSLLIC